DARLRLRVPNAHVPLRRMRQHMDAAGVVPHVKLDRALDCPGGLVVAVPITPLWLRAVVDTRKAVVGLDGEGCLDRPRHPHEPSTQAGDLRRAHGAEVAAAEV